MARTEPRPRAGGSTSHPLARTAQAQLAHLIPEILDPWSRLGKIRTVAPNSVLRPGEKKDPRAIPVPGLKREIRVKIAADRAEWKDAFRLVALNYQACGYEAPLASKVRFTPYHALPDSVAFVAKHQDRVLMTFTLVPDNTLLGLPLESIFGEEVRQLRRQRRRLVEVISLAADSQVAPREFRPIFVTMIKLMMHYHVGHGGDTWVITVNPRHRDFYTKGMGYVSLGPPRLYPDVQDHPAEAYMLDVGLMKANAPKMYQQVFGQPLPGDALVAPKMLPHLVRYLGSQTSQSSGEAIRAVFDFDTYFRTPRRW
jgi:hypothetical protein